MKKLFRRKKKNKDTATDEETPVTDQNAQTDEDDGTATNQDYDEELMDEENESDNDEEDLEQKQLLYHEYSDYTSEDLQSSLDGIIDSIDSEYRVDDFSYIDAIARSLKNGTDKDDLRKLKDSKKILDDAVKQIVCVNYKGFNKSIRNFSDMLELMEKGQNQVQTMVDKVKTTKELLSLRSSDLISLYSSYLQQKEILDILDVVQNVKNAPNLISTSIASKHFLHAARTLKTYNGMANSERLRSIKALHDIRDQFLEFHDKMPDIITDELKSQLHIHAYQKSLDMIDDDDWRYQLAGSGIPTNANSPITIPKLNSKLANQIKRLSVRPGLSPLNLKEEPEPEQKPKLISPQIQDNLSIDYEKEDPAQYVINLVEALDVLGTLSELQAKLVQNLRFELRHLIEAHVNEFSNSLKGSDRDLLWLIIQNKKLASNEQVGLFSSNFDDPLEQHKTNTGKAILQGRLISEMMEGLFIKLRKVMKNYQFLIKLLEQKLTQRDSSIMGNKELGSMSIVLSKQVITRIRESISKKLEDLRANFRTAGDFEDLLQECMEELMYNFIDKNYDESARQRVKDLILFFEVQVDLNTRDAGRKLKQEAEKVKSTFKNLVINTLSSPDTPSLLSIGHIWKTVEDEMGSVLKELLGLRNSDLDNSTKRKSTTNLSEFGENGKKKKKISDFNFEIKFKFSTNVDYPLMANNESEEQSGSMKILCESLNSYFIFSPYNIIWLYKVVTGFIDQVYSTFKIVNEKEEEDEDADEQTYSGDNNSESILQMFMDNFIIGAFMPLIEEDYRNKLSKLLTDQDKHNTNAFLPRESPNQTSSTYTYVSKTEKRPLLNSALFLASWLRELFKISLSLPVYKMSIFNVIEIVLKNYLASCKSQFDSVIRGKFIQQSLTAEYESVYPVLKSDPNFKLLYTRSKVDSSTYSKLSEKFYKKLFVLIDEKLQINYPHSLPKTKFIDNNSQLILLANINDSLEWLADLIKNYQKELIQTELFAVKTQLKTEEYTRVKREASTPNTGNIHQVSSDSNLRKPIKIHHLRVLSTDAESVTSDHSDEESNAIQRIKKSTLFLSNYERDYRDLAIRCLFSLKLDIRVHCYHFIHCNLMDNLLKFGTYDCEDERKEPEDFINLFNQDLFRIERYLSCYLPKTKLRYLFESIEKMILDLFIGSLPFAISQFYEMKLDDSSSSMLGGGDLIKSPSFSKLGLEKMMRNIFSLQQQLSSFSFVDETKFESIREYYYLLQMQSHQLLRMIETKSLRQLPFTQDQYEAILQTDYDQIKRDVKDVTVCRQFFEKKIKKQQEAIAAKSVNSPTTPTRKLLSTAKKINK